MRSMRATCILRFAASVEIPIRRRPRSSCGGRRRRRSMSWSAICAARTARRCAAILTSAAIWWRCERKKFRLATRANGERKILHGQHGKIWPTGENDMTDPSIIANEIIEGLDAKSNKVFQTSSIMQVLGALGRQRGYRLSCHKTRGRRR